MAEQKRQLAAEKRRREEELRRAAAAREAANADNDRMMHVRALLPCCWSRFARAVHGCLKCAHPALLAGACVLPGAGWQDSPRLTLLGDQSLQLHLTARRFELV